MLSFHRCTKRRLLGLLLACWASSGHAQQHLSADEAVALALAQPHVVQALDASVQSARSEVLAARTWANPELAMSQERAERGLPGEARETTVLLSQPFELGGRRGLRVHAAEQGVLAASYGVEFEKARLRSEVLHAYSAVVASEQRSAAGRRIAAALDELAGVAGTRHRAGDLSGYESRRITQASRQSLAKAALADAGSRAARARMAGWIGDIAFNATFDARPPLPMLPEPNDDLRSAELDFLQARRDHAMAAARAESRWGLPVSVGVGRKRVESSGASDDVAIIEFGVPLPLFDRNQAARARAAAGADQADADYQRAMLQTQSRRTAAYQAARELTASAQALFDTVVPEARQLTDIARVSFAAGELDLVGLLDAHQAETEAIEQAIEQQSRALDAVLELQLLTPLDIPTTVPPTKKEAP